MTQLQRLVEAGTGVVSREFLMDHVTRLDEEDYQEYVEPVERDLDLHEFDRVIDQIMDEHEAFETAIDPAVAPLIHQSLPLTRREAGDMGIWRFLTVIHRPDFVRFRWEYSSVSERKRRFLGRRWRWDSNTFVRLWWLAEQTAIGDDYDMTRNILRTQDFARAVLDRDVGKYRPAVLAAVEALEGENDLTIREVLKAFNQRLSVVYLESLSQDEIVEVLEELLADAGHSPVNT